MFAPVAHHLSHLLNTPREILHGRAVRKSHEIDTLAFCEVTDFTWVDIEEDSWHTNYIVFDTLLKEA